MRYAAVILRLSFVLILGLVSAQLHAALIPPDGTVQVTVDLTDGSHLIGTPSVQKFRFTTDYADLELPVARLSTMELGGTNGVTRVTMRDGDTLNGRVAAKDISLKTIFGPVSIPIAMVSDIHISGNREALPDGLVLRYTFDADPGGSAKDLSHSGNDGKVEGPTYINEDAMGGALGFNGNRQQVLVGNPPSLQLQNFSIVAWIKRDNLERATDVSGLDGVIFGYGHGGYAFGTTADGHLLLTDIEIDIVTSDCRIRDKAFHHVAVTKQGSQIVFYLDGVGYPGPEYNSNYQFNTDSAVGARADNGGNSFLGAIHEVAVFNRALSGDEIKAMYDSER